MLVVDFIGNFCCLTFCSVLFKKFHLIAKLLYIFFLLSYYDNVSLRFYYDILSLGFCCCVPCLFVCVCLFGLLLLLGGGVYLFCFSIFLCFVLSLFYLFSSEVCSNSVLILWWLVQEVDHLGCSCPFFNRPEQQLRTADCFDWLENERVFFSLHVCVFVSGLFCFVYR